MDIKVYDQATGQWVIAGTSSAHNIEVDNPGYLTDLGEPVSANNAFTKIDNRMTKLEQNLAWVYLNGAIGGGGGTGPGPGEDEYTIEVAEGDTVYTSTSSVTINVTIKSGTLKKSFTLSVKDLSTNKVIGTFKLYSLSRTPINISGLDGTVDLELSAYDSNNNYTLPTYVKVIAGAISLSIQSIPPKTIYIGGIAEVPANFTVTNNIIGSTASFIFTCNGVIIDEVKDITTSIRALSYDIRKVIFNNEAFNPQAGQRFNFEAHASTMLGTDVLESNYIRFDTTVADSNNLIIVTDDISDFVPSEAEGETWDDLTTYSQGSQLGFSYYFSYGLSKYFTFNMDYEVYKVNSAGDTLLDSSSIKNIVKGVTNRFVYSTVALDPNTSGEYIKIKMYGYAINDPGDTTAQYTKYVYCRITEATSVDIYANNDQETLLAYFSKVSGFPNTGTGTWAYKIPTSGQFKYSGPFYDKFGGEVKFTVKDVNGVTSGFLPDSDGVNSIPATRLQGESYGYLEVADQMFPEMDIGTGASFFQSVGFCISITYKADESSYPTETVLSIGKYEEDTLQTGYEITLEQVTCKIGSAGTLTCKLPQNELLTVDLDVSWLSGTGWYFKIFINGVLSAVTRVNQEDIDWMFGTDLYLGCRYDNGIRSRFSNVTIYDIKLYTSSQSEYSIVQNYISATEQASLIKGAIDPTLDASLREKNLFDSAGECLIWDKSLNSGKGGFLTGERLYNKLIEQMEINTPYPVVLIEETASRDTYSLPFEAASTAIFSAADKFKVEEYYCKITYQDSKGKAIIVTPSGVADPQGVRVKLQGTSSLSYNAKNYEIIVGDMDDTGKKLLFQPTEEWLPENQFTLKADVMDSAHVNNVVIGRIVNGHAGVTPFSATPPMALGNEVWGGDQTTAEAIRGKIKHTSEGFPCLLFIRFAPDADGNIQQPTFCGIYNFNLGRYAYYNLGLKLLTSYDKEVQDGPTLITDYTENYDYWNTSTDNGVYSIEINQNSSSQGAFQQDDIKIVDFMTDIPYTSRDDTTALNYIQKFYTQMANMALTRIQKYTMDDAGQTPTKPIEGEFYDYRPNEYYNFSMCDAHMNWDNACAYFIIALVFGMVDSMCKNLTLRNWGNPVTYLAFYDMDTAFGLNNAGQDIVEYWAHLHRWYNIASSDTGITTYTSEKNYTSTDTVKQYFASWWNRIWEVLENLASRDSGSTENRESLESTYVNLRRNLFPDPEKFINDYYKSYTDSTGSIIFNYDYNVKYLKIARTYNPDTGQFVDSTDFSQLKFLHGNRVMHVKDWFKRRIMFLDGVYGYGNDGVTIPSNIESPITSLWAANKATGSSTETKFGTEMAGNSKILYHYTHDKTEGAFWIDEGMAEVVLPMPTGETVIYMYANKYITEFTKFGTYPWTGLNNINLPLLESMNLSGLSNIDSSDFFQGGVYNKNTGIGLKNVRTLNLSRLKLIGSSASAYTLDVSGCDKLQSLDISYSTITKVTLPSSAVLKEYNLSGTDITSLKLENQSFLETLLIADCNKLTTIEINNCPSLTTLNVPQNVSTIIIRNCEGMKELSIPYTSVNNSISPLKSVTIDNCPGMTTFSVAGQNNTGLKIELTGAWNLEVLDLSNTSTTDILLPSINRAPFFTSLRRLNISNTDIYKLTYNDTDFDYLDLSSFPDLNDIYAFNCEQLTKVKCINNEANPIELQDSAFTGCANLTRVIGHYSIEGTNVFRDCGNLTFNTPEIYARYGVDQFIPGDDVTNISFKSTLSSALRTFENCIGMSYEDFRYVMLRLPSSITTLESTFKNCSGISGATWYDMFKVIPNVTSMREAFYGTRLSGVFFSRSSNYSQSDESTWGLLDFTPKLSDAESAFRSTLLEWIDNNVFAPKVVDGITVYSPLVKLDYMFADCTSLATCTDTRASTITDGFLESETFFTNLRNMVSIYPNGMFANCTKVKMSISEDENGNTLLFHTTIKPAKSMVLDSSVYTGIRLVGKIGPNVFGGITDTVGKYFIPTFSAIDTPFIGSGSNNELTMDFSQMGDVFKNLGGTLLQATGTFSGVTCSPGTGVIPTNILKGLVNLNSCANLFSGINGLDNNGTVYEFPPEGMFDDCTSLRNISGLISGNTELKVRLKGERFKNCQLTNVSNAFSDTHVIETIPYRLFFMTDGTTIRRTITNMSGVFSGCYGLGYDSTRRFSVGDVIGEEGKDVTSWKDHIVSNSGKSVQFKLDVTNMVKSYNYDRNEDASSEDYNPGEMAFDIWYLDGYGWEGATSTESGLDEVKSRLSDKYFKYDAQQKLVIQQQAQYERYMDTYQNYMIPTDLFRYCSKDCTCSGVLSDLNWLENVLEVDEQSGVKKVVQTENVEGLRGRMPVKIFDSLVDNTTLSRVFENTRFEAFVGLQGATFTRGIVYPPGLLKYNTALTDVSGLFKGTSIPVGTDIATDLFSSCVNLRTVSEVWSNCTFDPRDYVAEGVNRDNPQLDFGNIFKVNTRITNAASLFAVTTMEMAATGLYFIDSSLLRECYNINNISSMFYRNADMVGSVPLFQSAVYPVLNVVSSYLEGCTKSNITNADQLEDRLVPASWKA